MNVLNIAKDEGVSRFAFASSSSIYGDDPNLPKKEEVVGEVLSPYSIKICIRELREGIYPRPWMETIGMRYFNVFGPRQSRKTYAAVIPKFLYSLSEERPPKIFGDGLQLGLHICRNVVNANMDALFGNCEKGFGKSFMLHLGNQFL